MDSAYDADYCYEMVVNIVAEMVVEYLENTTRSITREIATCGQEEGALSNSYQPDKAA